MRPFLSAGYLSLIGLFVLAFTTDVSLGDVVLMKDGRRFEGTIILENTVVRIDAMVAGIRATLTLPKDQVKSIEKNAVAKGFYDPPPPPPRFSLRDPLEDPDAIYIEVPIVGVFGKDVFAQGVQGAITYAKRHDIRHIVFTIDSTGGNLAEAAMIFHTLDRGTEGIHLHAIIKKCYGDAMAIPVLCETVNLAPGGSLGGLDRSITEISKKYKPEDEQVVRSEIAIKIAERAALRGRDPRAIKALIDPLVTFAVWKDKDGQQKRGLTVPADTPKENIILQVGNNEVLKLNSDQAAQLGIPKFSGVAKDLGKVLELTKWKLESDYGAKIMAGFATKHAKNEYAAQAVIDSHIKSNIS